MFLAKHENGFGETYYGMGKSLEAAYDDLLGFCDAEADDVKFYSVAALSIRVSVKPTFEII